MKIRFLATTFLTLLFAAPLFAKAKKLEPPSLNTSYEAASVDQQIIQLLQSAEFSNSVIRYPFKWREYPIRIIHNPNKEKLVSKYAKAPFTTSLILTADLPYALAAHIENLVKTVGAAADAELSLIGYNALELLATVHPAHIGEAVDDAVNDELILQAFRSQEFVNLELHYILEGKYSKVRLLYNPARRLFSATKTYNLGHRTGVPHTITWDHIYGIITNNQVGYELINHIYDLSNTSLVEWYVNFDVHNGTKVRRRIHLGNTTYIYTLDSWFDYTEDFR